MTKLLDNSIEFTGAEIENAFVDGMFIAFGAGREVCTEDIVKALNITVPFSVSHREELVELRRQCKGKLVMINDLGEEQSADSALKSLSIDLDEETIE